MKIINKKKQFLVELERVLPIVCIQIIKGEKMMVVLAEYITDTLNYLKYHIGTQYRVLTSVSGVDFLGERYRFCVSYELLSIEYNNRIRVKVYVNETTRVESVVKVYKNADWWEKGVLGYVWNIF